MVVVDGGGGWWLRVILVFTLCPSWKNKHDDDLSMYIEIIVNRVGISLYLTLA